MKVKSFLVAALAMSLFAACSKDDLGDNPGNGEVAEGVKTFATFSFNVEGSTNTRAGMVEGAADEATIADVRLMIFDGEGTDAKLLVNKLVNGTKSETVEVTSGKKRIFVFGNTASTDIAAKLNGLVVNTATVANLYAVMSNPVGAETTVAAMGAEFTEMTTTAQILMSNVADATSVKTLEPNVQKDESANATAGTAGKNHFKFTVKRAIAKGSLVVKMAAPGTKDGYAFAGDITYGVRNVNRSVNYVQQFVTGDDTDGGADHVDGATRPLSPYYNVFNATTAADLMKLSTFAPYYYGGYAITNGVPTAGDVAQIAKSGAAPVFDKYAYFTENSNNKQLNGNTSYFGITASLGVIDKDKIAATLNVNILNGNITTTAATSDYAPGADFYLIRKLPVGVLFAASETQKRVVFTDETAAFKAIYDILIQGGIIAVGTYADATAFKTAYEAGAVALVAGGTSDLHDYFGVYKGGKCYYRLNIHETVAGNKVHLVRRNHQYNATVNSFATIGEPTEGDLDKDPETPVDAAKTHVTATIEVQVWHTVVMGGDL